MEKQKVVIDAMSMTTSSFLYQFQALIFHDVTNICGVSDEELIMGNKYDGAMIGSYELLKCLYHLNI